MPWVFWIAIGSVVAFYIGKAIIIGVREYRKDA